jgi:methylmalonyl-CoA mutase, N-terminal domain
VDEYFARIESLGGMLAAIERGWVQQEIQNAAYEYQRAVDTGEATVVGVNRFTRDTEPGIPTQRIDEALERKQVERLRALRAKRDAGRWQAALDGVREQARAGGNLMPAILEAAESSATVGEIASAMREVFGEYQESVRI